MILEQLLILKLTTLDTKSNFYIAFRSDNGQKFFRGGPAFNNWTSEISADGSADFAENVTVGGDKVNIQADGNIFAEKTLQTLGLIQSVNDVTSAKQSNPGGNFPPDEASYHWTKSFNNS